MRASFLALSITGVLVAACSNKDPFTDGTDAPSGDGGVRDGNVVDIDAAPRACAAPPSRVIVLGDSITHCTVIGGPSSPDCVSKKFVDYVKAQYAPAATYQNLAVGGARLSGIASQLAAIQPAPGPALVVIYIGGNDLASFLFQTDASAMAGWLNIDAQLTTVYDSVFAKLANTTVFPDGATLLMNTQYNPYDDCTAPPINLSPTKIGILRMFNEKVKAISDQRGNAALYVNQHKAYLGHGHNYDVTTCPYYQAGAAPFMEDTIHANAAGNTSLANVMNGGADRLYRDCIQ